MTWLARATRAGRHSLLTSTSSESGRGFSSLLVGLIVIALVLWCASMIASAVVQ